MEPCQEFEIDESKTLQIFQNENPMSPREWSNLGEMICWHNRYNLGDKHDYDSPEEFLEEMAKNGLVANSPNIILPLFLYDHSGITMSTKPFRCPWDSGQVGYIICRTEKIRENYKVKRISKKLKERVIRCLMSEVETYDQYLRGDVYGFALVETIECKECEHEEENTIDSCWGFYGDNLKENGILEYLDDNTRQIVEAQI